MYARKVSLCLKSESVSQFLKKVEHEVIPLFRKQKGFLDQLILMSDNGKMFYVYTFWENGEDAEKYRPHDPSSVEPTSHASLTVHSAFTLSAARVAACLIG